MAPAVASDEPDEDSDESENVAPDVAAVDPEPVIEPELRPVPALARGDQLALSTSVVSRASGDCRRSRCWPAPSNTSSTAPR